MPGDILEKLDIRTMVLVGGQDFGRCALAAKLPAALWPVVDRPALLRLLDHLANEGIKSATICCSDEVSGDVEAICTGSCVRTALVTEALASGTGGCIRDVAAVNPGGELFLVLSAGMMVPPPLAPLIKAHLERGADLTVAFNPGRTGGSECGAPAEIYLCRSSILRHVPAGGFSDIKEGLIPAILRAGGRIQPYVLDRPVGNFRDRTGYLAALGICLQGRTCDGREGTMGSQVMQGKDVFIHPTARVCGPVAIGGSAQISEGAVVVGPATIGQNVTIGERCSLVRSALWTGAAAGADCEIRNSIMGCDVKLADGTRVAEEALAGDGRRNWSEVVPPGAKPEKGREVHAVKPSDGSATKSPRGSHLFSRRIGSVVCGVAVLLAFAWSYWPTLTELMQIWLRSDEYSSGLLVPFLAVYIIWSRREDFVSVSLHPCILGGGGLLVLAQVARAAAVYLALDSLERICMLLSVAALVLLLLGRKYTWKLAPVLLFLCLMLPWPNRVQATVAQPLQSWATTSAVFCLELVGYEVVREGNIISLGESSVAVAEACNGLRMITAFFVISGLVILLVKRPWWEKLAVLASSLPIALLCNTLRLSITAVFFTILEGEYWEQLFHDWGGYAMMPLALALVVGEFWLLARLTTPPMKIEPAIITRREARDVPDA